MDSLRDVQHHGTIFGLKVILKIQNLIGLPLWLLNTISRVLHFEFEFGFFLNAECHDAYECNA